ncbi:MAG: cardiolipin synthase [Clostridia bacterium]|nr:cardiolipin synthase [Clostridia bacterium]
MKNLKRLLNIMGHRVTIFGSAILLSLLLVVAFIFGMVEARAWMHKLALLISALVVIYLINGRDNPSYKIAWMIPILCAPLVGGIFYVLFGIKRYSRKERQKFREILKKADSVIVPNEKAALRLKNESSTAASQSRYIEKYGRYPAYENTNVDYFRLGEDMFEQLKADMRKAEHYIFIETFIIEEGKMWSEILEILEEKIREGVDVRLIWDDFGSILLLPKDFTAKLKAAGIKFGVHYPLRPFIDLRLNNRDHRKITVIDGHTGYIGGINIADEYINEKVRFGHWKDTAVRLEGEAVWSLSIMFLTMWDAIKGEKADYDKYRPTVYMENMPACDGIVQPYSDNPLDRENVGATVYLNLINKAEKYVYITTPYLVIDDAMINALTTAAKNGVDVRIITPRIGDKWYVHAVTRAHYNVLVEAGVRIYEYTPGFIHAKSFVVDDKYAVVGTINMDYRSLYLHYECAVWMYGCSCIEKIRDDFEDTMKISAEVSPEEMKNIRWWQRLGRAILRCFAPMM